MKEKKHMKIMANIIHSAFAAVVLAMAAQTANGAPGDLIAPGSRGNIYQLPINPFGTPSLVWDNSNLPSHVWGGLAFDSSGNIYVSESYGGATNGAIWKLSADRSNLTLFASELNPVGLAVDAAGNVYAADPSGGDNSSIYKFTPEGVRSTFASGLSLSGYRTPNIFFDAQGNLWVPSNLSACPGCPVGIYQITPQGVVGLISLRGTYVNVLAIALDNSGNIWVAAHTFPGHDTLLKYVGGGGDPVEIVPYSFGMTGLITDTAGNAYLGQGHVVRSPPECVLDPPSFCSVNMADPSESLGQLAIQPVFCTPNTWTTKASLLQAVTGAAGAVVDGLFYVIDGSTGATRPPPQAYDPVADSWSYIAADPIARANTSVGVINNKIYVAEGWINADSNRATQALEIYDPATNSWRTAKQSTVARGGAACAVINGKLYVTGGSKNGGRVQPKDLEIYDPVRDKWSTGAPLPTATGGQGTALNGKFYVVGGAVRGVNTGMLQIYDPVTNRWTQGAPMPTPRGGVMPVAANGKLYVIGGNNGATLSTVEIYDPVSNTWTTGTPAPTARYGGTAGVIDSKIYATGGFNASSNIDGSLDVYTAVCQ